MRTKCLWIVAMVALVLVAVGCKSPTSSSSASSSEKAIKALSFTQAANSTLKQDYTAEWNDVSKRFNVGPLYDTTGKVITDLTSLKATFTLSDGASAKVGAVVQVSGTTTNDFTNDVTYTVTAQDGSTATYPVHVVLLSDKDIAAFSLAVGSDSYTGTISTADPYTIAVTVPNGTNVAALVASFTIPEGASATVNSAAQVSGTTPNNFTSAVKYTVTAQDLSTRDYTVTVTVLPPETLLISEYFEGTSYNKYLEITNVGSTVLDLSAYTLNLWNYNSSNAKNSGSDVVYPLTGTLAAGASWVYYYGTSATLLDTVAGLSNKTVAANLANFNGNDPIVLKHSGVAVDMIGKDDGALFGVDTKLIRRAGKTATKTYNVADWHVFPVTGSTVEDNTAGTHTAVEPAAAQPITEFVLTTSAGNVRGTVDEANKAIAVTAPAGTVVSALTASVLTVSNSLTAGGTAFVDQSTAVNFTSPVSFVVTGTDGSTLTYTVTVTVPVIDYVELDATHNYDFDGGIADARLKLNNNSATVLTTETGANIYELTGTAGTAGAVWASTTTSTGITLTGVVTGFTASNLYIQDQNAAICLYKSGIGTSPAYKLGDKIQITNCVAGTNYYGLLEVNKFGSGTGGASPAITVVQAGTTVYYKPVGSYGWTDRDLKFVRYDGSIATAPTSTLSYRGSFLGVPIDTTSTALFRTASTFTTFATSLAVSSTTQSYYGVLDVYRAKISTNGSTVPSTSTAADYFVGDYVLITSTAQIR